MCEDPISLLAREWGTIDWNQVWKERLSLHLKCRQEQECAQIYTGREKAEQYWTNVRKQMDRYQPVLEHLTVREGTRILDIGGGPGTLAIPLAQKGARVTVVEPAEGMVSVLRQNITEMNLDGITPIQSRWEDIATRDLPGRYEIVLACFSLGMPDIRDSIRRMERVCDGTVLLVWFSGLTPWDLMMADLWPILKGGRYIPGPKGDLLYLVLDQMGISPRVRSIPLAYADEYPDIRQAALDIRERIGRISDQQEPVIRNWLSDHAKHNGDRVVLTGTLTITLFWWEPGTGNSPAVQDIHTPTAGPE